jgi:LmbE family N-acetylglucosaminyl deacetylase
MDWIYISPHLDDAAYSCGGLIWTQSQARMDVNIWTVFAGKPPDRKLSQFAKSILNRWKLKADPTEIRRIEDIHSCQILGAKWRHFNYLDAIYRTIPEYQSGSENSGFSHIYPDESSLFGPLNQEDFRLIDLLADSMLFNLKKIHSKNQVQLVCPLGLGKHVDHYLTRCAAEKLGLPLLYYADFPYVQKALDELARFTGQGWSKTIYKINRSALAAWQNAIEAHKSQLSTFWSDKKKMQKAVSSYLELMGGVPLWEQISA